MFVHTHTHSTHIYTQYTHTSTAVILCMYVRECMHVVMLYRYGEYGVYCDMLVRIIRSL